MELVARFSGILGVVLFLFGVIGALLIGSFTGVFLIFIHLVIGILLLLLWFFTSGMKNIEHAGAALTGRTARFSTMAVSYVLVFIGILVLANFYAKWNDRRTDLTESGVHSLSSRSVKIVQELQKPLRLVGIEGAENDQGSETGLRDILGRYQYNNRDKVQVEFLDARKHFVEIGEQLGMKPGNVIYLEYGGKDAPDKAVSRLNETGEEAITNAILKLTRGEAKKIYYVQGHGEPALDEPGQSGAKQFADAVEDEHLKIAPLLLLQAGKIPEDATAVILAGPQRALQASERGVLISYAENGGRLILLAEPENRQSTDIHEIAGKFGIEIGADVVIDEQLRLFGGPQLAVQFVAQEFGTNPIVSRLNKREPPVFTLASSVGQKAGGAVAGANYDQLLKSGPSSWAESNLKLIFDAEAPTAALEAGDTKGPISIALAYEKKLDKAASEDAFERATRVVVFGDSSWLVNGNLGLTSNRDLILNALSWAVGQEGGASIEPRGYRQSKVSAMMQNDFNVILATSFLVPELILILGLFVWWRRRLA